MTRKAILDFTGHPIRFLRNTDGHIIFDRISLNLLHSVSQTKFALDRAAQADFALIVENYITEQKNVASKKRDEAFVKLSE